ncbi:MAG: putative DNA binding domain-containing protein [Odoribacteraceae bacterium]|nr:putative DNA binding domain-containing protein [Odoribacteraceae bacterium]
MIERNLPVTPFEKSFPSLRLEEEQRALCLTWWERLKEKHPLSLIETLGEELRREGITLEAYSALLPVYTRVQEWLIEDSDFLSSCPPEYRKDIREETEERLKDAYAWQEALRLIAREEELDYLIALLHKLDASGYLYDRERRLATLLAICRWSPRLIAMPAREFLRLLFLSEQDLIPMSFGALVERRLSLVDTRDFPYARRTPENLARIEDATRLIAAKLLTARGALPDVVSRASLFRLLYMLSGSRPELIRSNALNTLLFRHAGTKFTLSDLIRLDLSELVDKVLVQTSVSLTTDAKERVFNGRGRLMLREGTIHLLPDHASLLLKESKVSHLAAVPVKVASSKEEDLSATMDVSALSNAWKRVFQEFAALPRKRILIKERPPMGAQVKIQVKNLHPTNPLFAFVRVVDDHFEGDGILHVRQITRIKLVSLEHILDPGNKMTATVIESTPERLSFSIIEDLDAMVGSRLHPGETTNAVLLAKRDSLLTWLSEDGYSLYSLPNAGQEVEIGACHLLELLNVGSNGYVKAIVKEPVDAEIEVHEAVANLLYTYIDEEEAPPSAREEEEMAPSEQALPLSRAHVTELIQTLGLYVSPRLSPRNLNLLYALKLMAYIANDPVAEEFYAGQISYMLAIHAFVAGEADARMELFPDPAAAAAFVDRYPVLESPALVLELLSAWGDDSSRDRLEAFSCAGDPLIAKLSKLIIACNLLQPVMPEASTLVRGEITACLAEMPDEPEQEEEVTSVCFGTEDHHREFKTSAVFPPESTGEADVERQLDVILRTITGFLNAEGGTLYIGVNDFGIPSGIQADLSHLHGDADKYQLFIRQRVVENLGMDVNGLLVFRFMTYGQKVVCAISIPSYHQAVAYKKTVWQRQGNATRPVQKDDLKLLKLRKKDAGMSRRAPDPLFPGEAGYEEKAPAPVAPPAPLPAPVAEEKSKIATSSLQEKKGSARGYFSFLKQGKYMLSGEFVKRDDNLLSLAIPEDEESFLVQVYDTGHVNCVAMSVLSGKKRDFEYQNGSFANASLLFAAFVHQEDFFLLKILVHKDEHIKIIPVQAVKVNADLSLKGSAVIAAKFDRIVQVEILTPLQAEPLACKRDASPLGSPIRSLPVMKDMLYLDELFKTTKNK